MADVVVLPDLRTPHAPDPPRPTGWFVLTSESVSVPSLDDARRCAQPKNDEPDPCVRHVVSFDPPHRTVLIGRGAGVVVVEVLVSPGLADDDSPLLTVRPIEPTPGDEIQIEGEILDFCRTRLRFEWEVPGTVEDGVYELFVAGLESEAIRIVLETGDLEPLSIDPCALILVPMGRRVGISITDPPETFPLPPLLTVDENGCIIDAWSVNEHGNVIRPTGERTVEVFIRCAGGPLGVINVDDPVRDAIFWKDVVAVATSTEIRIFDLTGCPLTPDPLVTGLDQVVGLAISDEGFLVVVQLGPGTEPKDGNVLLFRRDGTQVLSPTTFDGRGWFARHRNRAFVFDAVSCRFRLEPNRLDGGCCTSPARDLTDEEALYFLLIDDLRGLRERVAYPGSGNVIIGPGFEEDPLDARRPAVQWHRIILFGEIPPGCAVRIETRSFDNLVAGDPLVPNGWSRPVTAVHESEAAVSSPGDTRLAAADAMVLARPGRYLWMRLTLLSDGVSTPRITRIEVERPREGIARFLPGVFQNSTPEDDFLRRWLALFEHTAFDGVARRMDEYAELFDPRRTPPEMLPFLSAWLEVLELARLRDDPDEWRRVLVRANELAETRGTVEGLVLAVKLYLDVDIQIVEGFKVRSDFILDAGATVDDMTGVVLGCQTILTAEPTPTWLGDEPLLGCSCLVDCERVGAVPNEFEVVVSARDACSDEELRLLHLVLDTEKPAHTRYCIRVTGAAGWVVGTDSVLGRAVGKGFDRNELDPATFGLLLMNGPQRPKPIGLGFALGRDSRLASKTGQADLRLGFTVGNNSLVGA
jgi:phage tail-like protein